MPGKLVVPEFKVRVLDPVSGNELIKDLPHASEGWIQALAVQPGAQGGGQVGDWELPLLPLESKAAKMAVDKYGLLAYNQRVEFYLKSYGNIVYSGWLRKRPQELGRHAIAGYDNLDAAARTMVMRTEQFSGRTDQLFSYALSGFQLAFADDLSAGLGSWTNNGGWTTLTDLGLPAVSAGNSGDGLLYTTTSFANAKYADCYVEADAWHLTCGSTPGNTAEAGLVAAVADANNMVMGRALMTCISSGRWEVASEIWQKSAGAWAQKAGKARVIVWSSNVYQALQVQLVGKQTTSTTYTWKVLIEGVDAGCVWVQTVTNGNPIGAVGIRSFKSGNSAGETAAAANFVFASKVQLYQPGSIAVGAGSIAQTVGQQMLSDLWQQASSTEGALSAGTIYRVDPKPGLYQDVANFGPAVARDLTGQVELQEGIERNGISDISILPNQEQVATALMGGASPSLGNSGVRLWHNIAAAKKYNLVWDSVMMQGVADALSQRAILWQLAGLRGTPGQAKRIKLAFTPSLLSSSGGLIFREGDYIKVNAPTWGLSHAKMQVMGWRMSEGIAELEIIGDQYPLGVSVAEIKRLRKTIEAMALGVSSMSPSGGSGNSIVFDNRTASPNILRSSAGYQGVDSSHNLRLRFEIPQNVGAIQRVLLSFSLQAWRASQQSTASGTTSGSSSANTTGAGSLHAHSFSISIENNGGASFSMLWDSVNKLFAISGASDLYTNPGTSNEGSHTHGMGHTHGIPNLALQSPTGLIDQAMAQGVHLLIAPAGGSFTDITSALGGPWGSGSALDVNDLDISTYVTSGGWWEVQLSSTTLGGIIANVDVVGMVTAL